MAKIGTAHVEIKPVLNQEALDALVQRIEDAIAAGVKRALDDSNRRASDATRRPATATLADLGPELREQTLRLKEVEAHIKNLAKSVGREVAGDES